MIARCHVLNGLFSLFLILLINGKICSQDLLIGRVVDAATREGLPLVSISTYHQKKLTASITNKEGLFSIAIAQQTDSVKFSLIGYASRVIARTEIFKSNPLVITLAVQPIELAEVTVRPLTTLEILEKAIVRLPATQPKNNFQTNGFYREIIKDKDHYFSVAEALFDVQFFPSEKEYKLKLDKGRAKQNVTSTALFEDYHPGGGPQQAIESSFLTGIPAFLRKKELKKFDFKKEGISYYDGRKLYVIAFDQKPGVKEALEKGKIFIDAVDFSIIKYEAAASETGKPYIKHLSGSDKVFAGLLGIDFKRKGWKRTVDFIKVKDNWFLNYADIELEIEYKQPKKKLDLDLVLFLELLLAPGQDTIKKEITGSEKWNKQHLVKNLPFAFDSTYWGSASTIIPTQKIKEIVAGISVKDVIPANSATGFARYNGNLFVDYKQGDSVVLIPTRRCKWENGTTGPMLYREIENNFLIETKLRVIKVNTEASPPDRGFQQCGIIIRSLDSSNENHIYLTIGTNGNKNNKIILTKTRQGKSRSTVNEADNDFSWLKLEKRGTNISVFKKSGGTGVWELIDTYAIPWKETKYQVGLIGFADFAGNAPKMYPDCKGIFTDIKLKKL